MMCNVQRALEALVTCSLVFEEIFIGATVRQRLMTPEISRLLRFRRRQHGVHMWMVTCGYSQLVEDPKVSFETGCTWQPCMEWGFSNIGCPQVTCSVKPCH